MEWGFGNGGHIKDTFNPKGLHVHKKRTTKIDLDKYAAQNGYGLETSKRRIKDQDDFKAL